MSEGDSDTTNPSKSFRAFDAVCLQEEKHAILGKAHEILAQRCRLEHLCRTRKPKDYDDTMITRQDEEDLREEFDDQLLESASAEVLADRDLMLQAMSASGTAFHRCSSDLRSDPLVALAAVQTSADVWQHMEGGILADREGMLKVAKANGKTLQFFGHELQDDKEFAVAAVSSDPYALRFASDRLKADRQVVLAALLRQQSICPDDCESVLRFVSSEALRADRDLLMAAVVSKPRAVFMARGSLKDDRALMIEAQKHQTQVDFDEHSEYILERAGKDFHGDPDVMLEAIRLNTGAFGEADPELTGSKDFLLRALRKISKSAHQWCYEEAGEHVRETTTLLQAQEAAATVLAAEGESAPVLTVSFGCDANSQQQEENISSTRSVTSCQVTLLSGASFTCDLRAASDPTAHTGPHTGRSSRSHSNSSSSRSRSISRPKKRAKSGPSDKDSAKSCDPPQDPMQLLTVGRLAKVLLEELPNHVEMETPPKTIFIIFTNNTDSPSSVPATPWDWNRPLSDFL